MSLICPTVTAYNTDDYGDQLRLATLLSPRVHIDLMDGIFTPNTSPGLREIWLPNYSKADIHLMYERPMDYVDDLISLKPNMVIIHAEADVDHMHFVALMHKENIKVGLALLQDTKVQDYHNVLHSFDHVLIFSGKLGHHGGHADLSLVSKVEQICNEHPDAEIGWDGGINESNILQLANSGIEILNVGGAIHKHHDPNEAYQKLVSLL